MSHTYDELKHMTVAQLREIAKATEHEAVKGYTQMNKDHLLVALCKGLGIDTHAHHHAVGEDKVKFKSRIRELKKKRDELLAGKNRDGLASMLREIHALKRRLRRAMV
jgi:hypothetical protein